MAIKRLLSEKQRETLRPLLDLHRKRAETLTPEDIKRLAIALAKRFGLLR